MSPAIMELEKSGRESLLDYSARDMAVFGEGNDALGLRVALNQVIAHYRVPISRQREDIRLKFRTLLCIWEGETAHLSSVQQIVSHPAYQQMIGLGPAAIPLLLQALQQRPDFLFAALFAIAEVNPVLPEHDGDVYSMAADWVRWGREEGFID